MFPGFPYTTAVSFVPSLELATARHNRTESLGLQLMPELVEVKICPSRTVATSLAPSLELATDVQLLAESLAVHVAPKSVDV